MAKSANVRKHATEEVALVVWFPSCHSGNCILPSHTVSLAREVVFFPGAILALCLAVELS